MTKAENQSSLVTVLLNPIRKARLSLEQMWRSIRASERALPSFIIAGTQKGGTSSLFAHLVQHPQILKPRVKELHYFDKQYHRGPLWYRSNFPFESKLTASNAITGEASPYYMFHPLCAERIHSLLPDVRLIFVLRNPIARAISQYFHAVRWNQESLSIEEAFAAEEERLQGEERELASAADYDSPEYQHHSYQSRGFYAVQLERYFELFPREQLLVMPSDELYGAPREALRTVFAHVGVDTDFTPTDLEPRNVGTYTTEIPERLRSLLIHRFTAPNQRLYELLGKDFGW